MMTIKRNQRVSIDFYIMHLMRFRGFGRLGGLGGLDPGPTPPLKNPRGGAGWWQYMYAYPPLGPWVKTTLGPLPPMIFFDRVLF